MLEYVPNISQVIRPLPLAFQRKSVMNENRGKVSNTDSNFLAVYLSIHRMRLGRKLKSDIFSFAFERIWTLTISKNLPKTDRKIISLLQLSRTPHHIWFASTDTRGVELPYLPLWAFKSPESQMG
jgi:hypothetical protein